MKYLFKYVAFIITLFVSPVEANIVDVWEFSNAENETRAVELAKQLRCPQCQNQNLVESTSPIARDLRLEVYQLIEEGKSDIEIIELMTDRFGDFVLYKTKFNYHTLLLWLTPFVLLTAAMIYGWKAIKRHRYDEELSEEQNLKLRRLLQQNGADIEI
jgi:cytochrome c nitrite reductase accessory protein NrfF